MFHTRKVHSSGHISGSEHWHRTVEVFYVNKPVALIKFSNSDTLGSLQWQTDLQPARSFYESKEDYIMTSARSRVYGKSGRVPV